MEKVEPPNECAIRQSKVLAQRGESEAFEPVRASGAEFFRTGAVIQWTCKSTFVGNPCSSRRADLSIDYVHSRSLLRPPLHAFTTKPAVTTLVDNTSRVLL